jgi:pyridoxamine 5'-phosphate oxidase
VRLRGTVETVTGDEADAYFKTRPRGAQLGAWASHQSQPMDSRRLFEDAVAAIGERYAGRDVPRPPGWSGWRIVPLQIEFWHDRPFRLHDRLLFAREAPTAPWRTTRLYP